MGRSGLYERDYQHSEKRLPCKEKNHHKRVTKTKKSARTISLPEIVISLAQEWKKEQEYYRLSIGSQWKNGGYIFTRWNGEMMGLETPYQILHRVINNYNATQTDESALLPLIPLHGLRHTAATLLIGSNVNIRTVASRLGHSDVTTTLIFTVTP